MTSLPISKSKRQSSTYWLSEMTHGTSPFNSDSTYKLFRNVVTDCGAKGDGITDDTAAIQSCIAEQNRCGANCGSSTVSPAAIYFPPGTYLVSASIQTYYYTQLIGDPINRPTILASSSFVGLGVISSDFYYPDGNGASWFINQSNFFCQVRNFIINIQNVPYNQVAGLHWQVAQATSLENIDVVASDAAGNNCVGMFMENGSGGMFSDVTFHDGLIGMQCGNQQFTTRNVVFNGCETAITSFWDWGWTWKSLTITGAAIGMNIIPDINDLSVTQETYSYMLLDSVIGASIGILTYPNANINSTGLTQITLDNVDFSGSSIGIMDSSGNIILAGGAKYESWALGAVFTDEYPSGFTTGGMNLIPKRNIPGSLLGGPNGGYFERSKPQYQAIAASSFVNALDSGCKGDGVFDNTDCLNALFSKPGYVFLPGGVYIVTDTVKVSPGMYIVGEAWSQIMAYGDNFADMNNPRVMLQVGQPGDIGTVELQDLLFTVKGPTAGAILVEWNIEASSPGAAAMWDCHFRVGGAVGSNLQATNCPKLSGSVNSDCIAASMLLHVTSWGSAYLENVWGWVADHDIDTSDGTQIDIYVARGALIESTSATWMYGTAMEHSVLYQYQVYGAQTLFMGMIQTESPYYQVSPPAPAPFASAVGLYNGDPDFSECDPTSISCAVAWGLRASMTQDVLVYGAGLYSWFQEYDQGCLAFSDCQDRMVSLGSNSRFFLYNLITVGTVNMVTFPGA
ncbi:pectate lyase superfamily protein-domain-containing protein, partial [Xylariales sp. PMI_506]